MWSWSMASCEWFSFWTISFRGVHFAVCRFTYGQPKELGFAFRRFFWIILKIWFTFWDVWGQGLRGRRRRGEAWLLSESGCYVTFEKFNGFPNSWSFLANKIATFARTISFVWIRPYCCQTNSIIQNDVAHVICTFIGLNLVCPGF